MSTVRFGNSSDPLLYRLAQKTYELPDRVEKNISKSFLGPKIGGFIKNQLNTDFAHFTSVEVGNRFKTMIAEPPRLPLLFLLYPATVGPRLYRAWERGKENNDFREMGDVLRRDLTAITLFVFALGPMVKGTSKAVQWMTGVNLLDTKSGNVLSYSQFKNYEITNGKALWQVVKEGNGRGLKNAMNRLNDGGLKQHGYGDLSGKLKALKSEVTDFVEQYAKISDVAEPEKAKLEKAGLAKATAIYDTNFKAVQAEVTKVLESAAKKEDSKPVIEIAKKLQGQTKDALKNYAKVRRLPTDMFAFAVMIGAIGWLPMAFNGWYNKRKFEEEMAAKSAAPATPAQPKKQTSLAQPQTQVQQPQPLKFPQPFGQTVGFSRFPAYNAQQAQHPVNPFIRPM